MKTRPAKILMLSASLSITGTHRILANLIEGLDRERFEIYVAYKPEYPGPGNDLTTEVRAMGIEIVPMRGRQLYSMDGLQDLFRFIVEHGVDIIHCWDSLSIAARPIGKLKGAKVIDTIGNPPVDDSWKYRLANRITSPLLDGLIFQSIGSQEAHQQKGSYLLYRCKEKVIYNAFDLSTISEYSQETKVQIRQKYGFRENEFILLNSGMFNEQKSQEHLIDALPKVLENHKDIRLVILGWGERELILKKHIRSRNLEKHILLAGKRQRSEVFEFLSIADVYVSSSLWEGLPMAVLEAMAIRLPVVATDVIGNREAIADKETGLLVPARNPYALGEAILTVINDKELRKKMGDGGRERVAQYFDPNRFIREHENYYQKILQG